MWAGVGQVKGALVSVLYVIEIPLLFSSRPFNDIVTVWCERTSAITNAVAALAVARKSFSCALSVCGLVLAWSY